MAGLLDEIRKSEALAQVQQRLQGLLNIPIAAQQFMVSPASFMGLLGRNPLPKETGFAAGSTGLPAQEMSVLDPNQAPYMQGYSQGEPVGYAGLALPLAAPASVAGAKALGPTAGRMAEDYLRSIGGIANIAPQNKKTFKNEFEGTMPQYTQQENLANVFENVGLKVKETGSSHSNSKYVEIYDPVSGELITARLANHLQSGHAISLHGTADIEIGDIFKYKSYNEAVMPILEMINKSRKQYGYELVTIKNKE